MGEPGDGDHRGRFADSARQSFPRHAGPGAAAAQGARARAGAGRPQGHQGPGERQARARSGGRGRAQSPDDRASRRGQIDAGGATADDPAAADPGGAARSLHDRVGRGRHRGRCAHQPPPVPQPASFRQHAGAGGRRLAGQARRNLARASWRPLPRRVSGVSAAGARLATPAARDRRGRDLARQQPRDLSGALHAGRRDEPLPLRSRLRARLHVQAGLERPLRRRLPGASLGSAHRSHRPHHRGARCDRRRPDPASARRRQP